MYTSALGTGCGALRSCPRKEMRSANSAGSWAAPSAAVPGRSSTMKRRLGWALASAREMWPWEPPSCGKSVMVDQETWE